MVLGALFWPSQVSQTSPTIMILFFFSLFRYYHLKIFKVQILGGVSSQRQLRFEWATRSLATFIRSHHSLALQRSAALCFATLASLVCSIHRLAHLLRSLPRGTVEILEYVFPLLSHFTGSYAFFIFTRNTPSLGNFFFLK